MQTRWIVAAGGAAVIGAIAVAAVRPPAPPAEPAIVQGVQLTSWQPDRRPVRVSPQWQRIGTAARAAVAAETPDRALPIQPVKPGASDRLIIAHYIPVFPLSIDGKPPPRDYYAVNYLDPAGEGGKHRAEGGFLRERPLPAPAAMPAPYRDADAAIEVARAARIGIDAFGVDLLALSGQTWKDSVRLLDASSAVSPQFRIIPEPDMGAMPSSVSVEQLADALAVFHRHPAGYRLRDGRLLVMPFMAERRKAEWWQRLIDVMAARQLPIVLAPVFLESRTMPAFAPFSIASSVWGDRYASGDVANRQAMLRAAKAGIRPWFAPVAAQDYRPKDSLLMEARNSEALRRQWRSAIDARTAGVHLLTWNDYSESTQLQPSSFSQFVFYDLNAYYAAWYKRGRPPTIERDVLYAIHRPQIVRVDGPGRRLAVRGPTKLTNEIEIVALLTAPGEVAIETRSGRESRSMPAGLSVMRVPAVPGRFTATLRRKGRAVAETRSQVEIDERPWRQDATYGGGSSSRPFVTVR